MNINEVRAVKVWFDDDNIWLGLEDGRNVSAPLAFYPRILNATKKQRENYSLAPVLAFIGKTWTKK